MTDVGKLIDCAGIVREYGVSRTVAEKLMRDLPKVAQPAGVKKVYVFRADLDALIAEATVDAVSVAARRRRAAA